MTIQVPSPPWIEAEEPAVTDVSGLAGRPRPLDARRPAARQPRIWGDLMPLRNPDFVGREELLERLRWCLVDPSPNSPTSAVLPVAFHGLGGVGKSQTVAEYIHRHAGEYDVVWWIAAEQPNQIRDSMLKLGRHLGMSSGADVGVPEVLEALRKGEPYSRWILVFNNASGPDAVRDFLPVGTGHIVVTSRNSQWSGVARTVEVDLFTRAESNELLRRRGDEISDADADRLAEALGDLPMAIEQAVTWRAQTGMQVSEYLGLLEDNRSELLQMGTAGEYQSSVAAAWIVSLNTLRNDHPEALELLRVCAFFGPEPISRRLFSGISGAPVPEKLRNVLSDPIRLNSAIREISRYSLAKIDHRNNTIQLHRLVQAVLRNQVTEQERDELWHVAHLLLVNGDPNDAEDLTYWPRYAELLPHANATGAHNCSAEWVRGLLINLVRYLINIGSIDEALTLSKQAWEAWETKSGVYELKTLIMGRNYGYLLRRKQQFKFARQHNQRIYDLILELVGADHEAVLSAATNVAQDLRGEGKFIDELALRKDTYDRACRVLGPNEPTTLVYGFNLASAMREVGDYVRARELDEEIYRRRLVQTGPEHLRTCHSLDAVAMDLRECGQYVEACEIEEASIAKQQELFGRDHPNVIGALRNLAVSRRKAGDPEGALALSRECYALYGRRVGEKHLDTITSLMCVSVDLRHYGDLDRSREHGDAARERFEKLYGPDHPYVHIAGTNVSVTLRMLGDLEGARALNECALRFYHSYFGSDHPTALVIATNLASDLAALGDINAAHSMDQDTVERSARVLGDEHPSTLAVKLNLSLDLSSLGQTDQAAVVHKCVVEAFHRALGADHRATIAAMKKVRANCDTDTMQL